MDAIHEAQDRFCQHVAYLISFIRSPEHGFNISFGEAWRTKFQQQEYVRTGFSKTMESKHLERLAIDINFFKDGRLLLSDKSRHDEDYELLKPIGEYWEDLNPKNRWGANFPNFFDAGHFETSI